jgi:hypothetical protein
MLTGHTLSNSAFKLWSGQDLSELKVKTTFDHVLTGHTLSNSASKLWSGRDLSELKVKRRLLNAVERNQLLTG